MSTREQQRAWVLARVCEGAITLEEAAELMAISLRHARRLKAALLTTGPRALVHGNRGRASPQRTDPRIAEAVVTLYRTRYAGTNTQHFTELLAEAEHLALGVATVRRILTAAGLPSPRTRRVPAHRRRRERAPHSGMLLQVDGSRHRWLEDRGPQLTLLAAIDDATGTVVAALFREQEDSQGYFLLVEQIVRSHGVPGALYHDGHGIFVRSKGRHPYRFTIAEQVTGRPALTQFGRLLQELGIGAITAHSPQAKGRIERLWGTFQDRLVTELRLMGAKTLLEATVVLSSFVGRYNERFAVLPAEAGSAYRPLPADLLLERVFCFKYERVVAADNTVQLGPHRLQLRPDRHRVSYARAKVEIQVRMDGAIAVYYQGRLVTSEPAPLETPVLRIQGARVTYRLPSPPPPVRPLPFALGHERMYRNSLADGIVELPAADSARPLPGRNHPWRKAVRNDVDQAVRFHAQHHTDGQNH